MAKAKDLSTQIFPIKLGDKKFLIRFDLYAMARLEELYDSIEDAFQALQKGSITAVINLLWAGAVGQDPTLEGERKNIGRGLSLKSFTDIQPTLMKAIEVSLPTNEQAKELVKNTKTQKVEGTVIPIDDTGKN